MKKRKTLSRKESSSFKITYIFLILIFAAGITFLVLSFILPQKSNDNEVLNTTFNETEKEQNSPSAPAPSTGSSGQSADDKTPKQNEDESDAAPDSINASVTMNGVSNGKYTLRITIYELLNSGTCELKMESANGSTIKRTANIIATGANSSSCEGFDIRTDGVENGAYNFIVILKSDEKNKVLKGVVTI